MTEHTSVISAVAWNPTSNLIASADESGMIYVWNAATGEIIASASRDAAVHNLVWGPDGRALASAGEDGKVRVWKFDQSELTEITAFDYHAPVHALAWSPDGAKLAYGGEGGDGQDGEVEIVDVSSLLLSATETP